MADTRFESNREHPAPFTFPHPSPPDSPPAGDPAEPVQPDLPFGQGWRDAAERPASEASLLREVL